MERCGWCRAGHDHGVHPVVSSFISCRGSVSHLISLIRCSINDQLFLQSPIDWEWGLIFVSALIFLGFAESYKAAKRRFLPSRKAQVCDLEAL